MNKSPSIKKNSEPPKEDKHNKSITKNNQGNDYFGNEESYEFDAEVSPSQERELRKPYQFKSGAIYLGEWLGNKRDGKGT
jgi:hypothetical protein